MTGYFVLKIIHNDHTLGFILHETSEEERVGSYCPLFSSYVVY